jgi:hypothetical protein
MNAVDNMGTYTERLLVYDITSCLNMEPKVKLEVSEYCRTPVLIVSISTSTSACYVIP